jgi:hypothetical protein
MIGRAAPSRHQQTLFLELLTILNRASPLFTGRHDQSLTGHASSMRWSLSVLRV